MLVKFIKNVSKGSRFNQVYIPKDMENLIEVGDEVEVRLIKKGVSLYYSKNLKKLSEFKESLIKGIFSFFNENFDIAAAFVVGSFLTEKVNYNDIDLVLIMNKKINNFEEMIYDKLIEKFNLKFHLLTIEGKKFLDLLKICPLTRSMFSKFICNKPFSVEKEKLIDKKHIKFLLMMPYDLLDIRLSSRSFFDSIRRLITIERFIKNKSLDMEDISIEIKNSMPEILYRKIKNNEEIENNSILALRKMIKSKLNIIEELLENNRHGKK